MKRSLGLGVLGLLFLMVSAPRADALTFTLYDDFESTFIDPNKWFGSETSPGSSAPNGEAARLIFPSATSRELALVLFSHGSTADNTGTSSGNSERLRFINPNILALAAQVTVQAVFTQPCAANATNGTRARALIQGFFFNDGSSAGPSDETGDIAAGFQMVQDSLTGLNTVEAFLFRCTDALCNNTTSVGSGVTFVTRWAVGQPHQLVLVWDSANSRFVFFLDPGTATAEMQALTYTFTTTKAPAFAGKELRVRNTPANCTAGRTLAVMFASFDNVFIGQ